MDEKLEEQFDDFIDLNPGIDEIRTKRHVAAARPILIDHALKMEDEEDTIQYNKLADKMEKRLDESIHQLNLTEPLGALGHIQYMLDEPLLSALVVSVEEDEPGIGFFKWGHIREVLGPKVWIDRQSEINELEEAHIDAWKDHLQKVYEYDSWYEAD